MTVFVIDRFGQSLMPCTEKRARLLLQRGRARVKRIKPFVIILLDRTTQDCQFQPLEIKLDPGSKLLGTDAKSSNAMMAMNTAMSCGAPWLSMANQSFFCCHDSRLRPGLQTMRYS